MWTTYGVDVSRGLGVSLCFWSDFRLPRGNFSPCRFVPRELIQSSRGDP